MPITDYASLLETARRWSGGSSSADFEAVLADSVGLAETDLNDLLRVPEMVRRSRFTASAEYEALPSDCLRVITVGRLADDREYLLTPVDEGRLIAYAPRYAGDVSWYALVGAQARFAPVPTEDAPMPGRFTYYARVDPLTGSSPCTAVLTRYPNVYLYGALKHLALYTENAADQARWDAAFAREIQKANRADVLREATLG